MKCFILDKDVTRKEAKIILKCMQEIIDRYGYVTLADFYDLIGRRAVYTDNKKGWHSLTGAKVSIIRKNGHYSIKLPNFVYIFLNKPTMTNLEITTERLDPD